MAGKRLLRHKNKLATFGNNPKIASPTSHTHSRNQKVRHAKVSRSSLKKISNARYEY